MKQVEIMLAARQYFQQWSTSALAIFHVNGILMLIQYPNIVQEKNACVDLYMVIFICSMLQVVKQCKTFFN